MALTPSITVSQSALNPALINIVDTSTGSDGDIVTRHVFFQTPQGTYLLEGSVSDDEAYVNWPYADAEENFDVLTQDYALSITVDWLDAGGEPLYTLTQVYCFPQYNKQFFYYLIQQQALSYSIMGDSPYFKSLAAYWVNIEAAVQAVEIGADIAASQACLDRATNMMANQNTVFAN